MFENLSERLSGVFDRLTKQGALSDEDVKTALREVRVALLEADVSLPVARDFVKAVQDKATGQAVTKSVTPGQQVVKIVHDELQHVLAGDDDNPGELKIDNAPAPILMVGLQGSGKTTTTGKLARRLKEKERKKVLLASLDVRRPAAMQQLAILAEQVGVSSLPIVEGQLPVDITKRALQSAKLQGFDVVILDTAGRTTLDEQMMNEADDVAKIAKPQETLLVADALTGQDAVETAKRFHERLPLTGLVLTRMDGDGRGGAALSMRAVTGLPIKFLGVGEKLDGLEVFAAKRVAGRILGRGDIVSLVEKAGEQMDAEKAERLAKKMAKGQFDLDDLAEQLRQLQRMGGLGGIAGMLPGAKKAKQALAGANMDDSVIKRQEAIISSMTKKERAKPALLNASRRKRIAAGAGVEVSDVNKVLKMHKQMSDMMKKMGKGGMKGLMGAMGGMGVSQGDLAKMAARNGGMGGGMPGLGGPGAPGGLPGLGGGALPGGLPGLPGAKKK